MAGIFEKIRLTPTQLRTVADRRFDDAMYLCNSNQNRHANGVYYLGGFVLECLLKALMLERYPELKIPTQEAEKLAPPMRHRINLVYRWHDLTALLAALPEALSRLDIADRTGGLRTSMIDLCGLWSVFARYSPRTAMMRDASDFLKQIKDVKRWLG